MTRFQSFISIIIVGCILTSINCFAQNLGYMGKKTSFGYKLDVGPNLGGMSPAGKTLISQQYEDKGSSRTTETGVTFHHCHGGYIERIIGKKTIFHVSVSRMKYGSFRFSEYLKESSSNYSSSNSFDFQKIPSLTIANDIYISLIQYTGDQSLSAPLGFHVNYGIHIIDSQVRDVETDKKYLQYDHLFPMISIGFGKTVILLNSLKLDYGLNFNFKPGNIAVTALAVEGLIEGPDPDLSYITLAGEASRASKKATLRSSESNYFGGRMITFTVAVGLLTK